MQIRILIEKLLQDITGDPNAVLERPNDTSNGDYASNIALRECKRLKRSPVDLANEYASKLDLALRKDGITVRVAGNGFINFTLPKKVLALETEKILKQKEDYGLIKLKKPQRILVEYGQPNTHKLPHIGHLFSYICGESIARLIEQNGHVVRRVNYQGDIGPHVAKSLYAWIKKGKPDPKIPRERVELLQQCYQEGSALYAENEDAKKEIGLLNQLIYKKAPQILQDWEITRSWSLDYYREFEKKLGISQVQFYVESGVWEIGLQEVKNNIGKVFSQSEGAVVFEGERFGFHTRVFITKAGNPTYEAKDMGLIKRKKDDWIFDLNVITTAVEQNEYFKVIIAAAEILYPELKDKLKHIGFGMISLKSGKMSSRTGKIVSAMGLVEEVELKVKTILSGRPDLNEEEKEKIVTKVALGAIKYAFLRGNISQNMAFDIDESVSLEGNSGPYIQYTCARGKSILRKHNAKTSKNISADKLNLTEVNLLRQLYFYHETLEKAYATNSPHLMCTYLFFLAQSFNSFYNTCNILTEPDPVIKNNRLNIVAATVQILSLGLDILGIETVEKM